MFESNLWRDKFSSLYVASWYTYSVCTRLQFVLAFADDHTTYIGIVYVQHKAGPYISLSFSCLPLPGFTR